MYKRIRRYHWHPLLRIKAQESFKPRYRERRPLQEFLPGPGYQWRGRGWAFKRRPLRCTLLAIWLECQAEPWFLLTDLSPHQGEASWYGLRVWIELGFRVFKSIGWQWHRSRITIPQRAERLWLALTLATTWTLVYGTHVEDQQQGPPAEVPWPTLSLAPEPMAATDPAAPPGDPGLERVHGYQPCTRKRRKSLLRQGLEALSERLWGTQPPLRRWRLIPEPWPGVLKNG